MKAQVSSAGPLQNILRHLSSHHKPCREKIFHFMTVPLLYCICIFSAPQAKGSAHRKALTITHTHTLSFTVTLTRICTHTDPHTHTFWVPGWLICFPYWEWTRGEETLVFPIFFTTVWGNNSFLTFVFVEVFEDLIIINKIYTYTDLNTIRTYLCLWKMSICIM